MFGNCHYKNIPVISRLYVIIPHLKLSNLKTIGISLQPLLYRGHSKQSFSILAELRTLVVYPKYKRKGIGSTLVETCKNKAREIGYESLYALVKPDAYDFFRKQGFEEVG